MCCNLCTDYRFRPWASTYSRNPLSKPVVGTNEWNPWSEVMVGTHSRNPSTETMVRTQWHGGSAHVFRPRLTIMDLDYKVLSMSLLVFLRGCIHILFVNPGAMWSFASMKFFLFSFTRKHLFVFLSEGRSRATRRLHFHSFYQMVGESATPFPCVSTI